MRSIYKAYQTFLRSIKDICQDLMSIIALLLYGLKPHSSSKAINSMITQDIDGYLSGKPLPDTHATVALYSSKTKNPRDGCRRCVDKLPVGIQIIALREQNYFTIKLAKWTDGNISSV